MLHPSAFVHSSAKVHESAIIGPWCVVDEGAVIGENVVLESRVRVYSGVTIKANTHVYDGAILGTFNFGTQTHQALPKINAWCSQLSAKRGSFPLHSAFTLHISQAMAEAA